jgi:hypothetical protein
MGKRKSRNNRRKTMGLYSTNPTQYMQLTNFDKYDHILDGNHIVVINKRTRDPKGVFNYNELINWLEANSPVSLTLIISETIL